LFSPFEAMMKTLRIPLLALACAAAATSLRAQAAASADTAVADSAGPAPAARIGPLTDAEVETALAYGKVHPNINLGLGLGTWGRHCRGSKDHNTECGFQIVLQGPHGRVVTAASARAGQYLPYSADSVTVEMRSPVLTVQATPTAPEFEGSWRQSPPVQRIVLQARAPRGETGAVVQPLAVRTYPMQWTNALGAVFQGQGAIASFDMNQVPAGDFDVVLVTGGREVRATVTAREWRANAVTLR
jgi:hypothetical protein